MPNGYKNLSTEDKHELMYSKLPVKFLATKYEVTTVTIYNWKKKIAKETAKDSHGTNYEPQHVLYQK